MTDKNFGDDKFGQYLYGGLGLPAIEKTTAACFVSVYDQNGNYKAGYQNGIGDFIGCEFTLDSSGCRDFTLMFAKKQDIKKRETVKIYLFTNDDIFFTGVVRKIPIDGSTEARYDYSGFGLNDYLIRLNTGNLSYAGKSLTFIVTELLDDIITVNSPIKKNVAKINLPAVDITAAFAYVQINDALQAIVNIAAGDGNEYIMGVDSDGDFFVKPRDTSVQVTLVVGARGTYGIDEYNPEEEAEPRTKFYVHDKNGVFINTVSSALDNDIFEEKLTAPDIDNTSAILWATGLLTESEAAVRRASIRWAIEEIDPMRLIADGTIRIISNIPPENLSLGTSLYGTGTYGSGIYGGNQYDGKDIDDTLKITQVKYSMTANASIRDIELGSMPVRLDEQVIEVRKNLSDLRISLGR